MAPKKDDEPKKGMTLGQYLAAIRSDRKLTLREVEDGTNKDVSNAYLSQIENNKIKQPSPHILNKLAELYGIDFLNLMELAGYISSTDKRDGDKRHGRVATFAEQNLTPEEEAALQNHLQFLRWKNKHGDPG